jgi:hypothetical protein
MIGPSNLLSAFTYHRQVYLLLPNDAALTSDYTTTDDNELKRIRKEAVKAQFKTLASIRLKGLRKTTIPQTSQNSKAGETTLLLSFNVWWRRQ